MVLLPWRELTLGRLFHLRGRVMCTVGSQGASTCRFHLGVTNEGLSTVSCSARRYSQLLGVVEHLSAPFAFASVESFGQGSRYLP